MEKAEGGDLNGELGQSRGRQWTPPAGHRGALGKKAASVYLAVPLPAPGLFLHLEDLCIGEVVSPGAVSLPREH